MAGAADSRTHRLELGHGFELISGLGKLDGSVEVTIAFRKRTLFRETFAPDDPPKGFKVDLKLVRADAQLDLDAFAGELSWAAHLSVRLPRGWRDLYRGDRRVLLRFGPAIGEVGGSPKVFEPVVDHPTFGKSQLCTPVVLRIFVDDQERAIAEVGQIVKEKMFPDRPGFTFNTVACVGHVPDGTPGLYTDPTSPWFNVFFGFYQLDCPKAEWGRPFGYESAAGIKSTIKAEDVARLGRSDWNWFSNWMYGVPMKHVLPYSSRDLGSISPSTSPPRRIGASMWHGLTLRGVEVASTYESTAKGAARLTMNTIIDDVWRNSFGLPSPQPGWDESFVPTKLVAQVDMAYWEDDASYHTVIFGGTAAVGADGAAFLAEQMTAVRRVIETNYPTLGFEPA
jgi:hypothetical protein